MAEVVRENQTEPSVVGGSTVDWWAGALEEDLVMALDASEGGLWSGSFVPPPPRPIFLDDAATPDGLTTCDLCSWAWQGQKPIIVDTTREAPGELSWVLTLVIVSVISAAIGAVIMIIFIHCKSRMKNGATDPRPQNGQADTMTRIRPPISTPSEPTDKDVSSDVYAPQTTHGGVWSWLTSRRSAVPSSQLTSAPGSPAENHYTHMDENYSSVGEALYAELDRDPAYQNSAYTDPDLPTSSAPSSAYYSDLSVTTNPDRAYEVVGLNTIPCWEGAPGVRAPPARLAAISETVNMPSDYV
ncbi:uncharacterized protein CBL_11254 [Carabus blaptoides fortunei]